MLSSFAIPGLDATRYKRVIEDYNENSKNDDSLDALIEALETIDINNSRTYQPSASYKPTYTPFNGTQILPDTPTDDDNELFLSYKMTARLKKKIILKYPTDTWCLFYCSKHLFLLC